MLQNTVLLAKRVGKSRTPVSNVEKGTFVPTSYRADHNSRHSRACNSSLARMREVLVHLLTL